MAQHVTSALHLSKGGRLDGTVLHVLLLEVELHPVGGKLSERVRLALEIGQLSVLFTALKVVNNWGFRPSW